ncbi:MAG: hypothetical protein ACTHLA_00560 [Asticcacaulis sp.]|uniref:hypothetical protein n=1 Tax=Asticcacaulis sp. TaxID=1872648 RepID=UPI003F7CC040
MTKRTAVRTYPHTYEFSVGFKALLVVGALALIALGIWGTAESYLNGRTVMAQFAGCAFSIIPFIGALIVVPALWRCKLVLYKQHLEYHGLLIDRTIRKQEIQNALRPEPRFGMFSVILRVYGQPFNKLHIAVLGRADDALNRWMKNVPTQG